MRGLKQNQLYTHCRPRQVASFTDAWIETYFRSREQYLKNVASFTDAWIETRECAKELYKKTSHLLQMRGLKHKPGKDMRKS